MKEFFRENDAICALLRVVESWRGTPFIAHARAKGRGVDCVHLCAEIYRECGLFAAYEFPSYTIQGGQHTCRPLIEDWLRGSPHFVPVPDIKPGDLLAFNFSKSAWHIGIALPEMQFIHSVVRRGVMRSGYRTSPFTKALSAIYRPISPVTSNVSLQPS